MPIDLIRRFCSTPLAATLNLDGMTLRVASNDQLVLDRLQRASCAAGTDIDDANIDETPLDEAIRVDWRIVVEEEDDDGTLDHESTLQALAHDGLNFIRLTQRSFLASDRLSNFGFSFVEQSLMADDRRFLNSFLPAFRSMLKEMREWHDEAGIRS